MINQKVYRWETLDKYYEAHIGKDIFDQLVVTCFFGSKLTKGAKRLTYPVDSLKEAYELISDKRLDKCYPVF